MRDRKIVAGVNSSCCAGCGGDSGGGQCNCSTGYFTQCPGTGGALCCSAKEWDADITASGSCICTVGTGFWNLATGSGGTVLTPPNTPGLFTGNENAIPQPPPTDGKLFEGTWTLNMTNTKRCVGGFNSIRSTGTLRFDYIYYGFSEDTNTWGMIAREYEITWTDEPGVNLMNVAATVNNIGSQLPFVPVAQPTVPTSIFPPVWGPLVACVEAYSTGSLQFPNALPWYGMIGGPSLYPGAGFFPELGYYTYTGIANGSNNCAIRSNNSRFDWVLYGLPGGNGPFTQDDWQAMGNASQQVAFSLNVRVLTPCDPDPCDGFGGL